MSMQSLSSFIQRMECDTAFRTKVLASNGGERVEILREEGYHFTPDEYSTRQGQILEGALREDGTKEPGSDIHKILKDPWLSQSFHSEKRSEGDRE